MDGIDWITVAEVVPISAAMVAFGALRELAPAAMIAAAALCGATLGFAPFNRPTAKLFLGDVGSLPIGLMLGWIMLLLAGRGHLAAALLLAAPWTLNFASGDTGITAFYVVAGIAVLAVSLVTNYQYSPNRDWAPAVGASPTPA